MTASDIAPILIAAFTIIGAFITGAFWLSRVQSASQRALEDLKRVEAALKKELSDIEDKILPSFQRRMEVLEAKTADTAVLSAQMTMVIDRLSELSASVQLLISTQARHDVKLEGKG